MRVNTVRIIPVLLVISRVLFSADIHGVVYDRLSDDRIPEALIVLEDPLNEDFKMEILSGKDGVFTFREVPEGTYKLAALKEGYYSNSLFDFTVVGSNYYDINIKLMHQKGQWNAEYCFMIGGIEVKAREKEVIPEEMVTVRRIDSGEIEHMQADNLGDILTLVPGVEKSKQIGLSDVQSIGIRQVSNRDIDLYGNETFGTTIVVNGNEINNDASISALSSSMASGIDLRGIPADNIESVEVITGIPSVEYGNFADGVVNVKTKSGERRSRIKAKFNPDTKGVNFSSGLKAPFGGNLDYHINYAYSERDIRKTGDEYHRFHVNATYSGQALEKKLDYALNGSYTRSLDDELPTDSYQTSRYDRGYLATAGTNWTYKSDNEITWDGNLNVDLNRRDLFKSRYIADQIDSIIGYIGEVTEEGREWESTFKIKRTKERKISKNKSRKTLFGLDLNYQENTGSGIHLDSIFNYYGAYSTQRSYSFDDFPGFAKLAVYGEHSRKGRIAGHSIEWMAGLRYDAINVKGLNISGSSFLDAPQGEFLAPRANVRLELRDGMFLRFGAGRSVKAVSLRHIYKNSAYVKTYIDGRWVEVEYDQTNPDLQGYYSDKAEMSLDWKLTEQLGLTITGYYSESSKQPSTTTFPTGYDVNPDTLTSLTYSIVENHGWTINRGLEATLATKRIHDLKFVLNTTYRYSRIGEEGFGYDGTPLDWQLVWVPNSETWKEKVIIGQQTSYINQRLGVWLTVDLQFIALDRKRTIYNGPSIITEIDGHEIEYFQGMGYWYSNLRYDYGSHWVVNARLSKALGQNTEVSLYVNNVLDDPGLWTDPFIGYTYPMNVPIYYGLEVSTQW